MKLKSLSDLERLLPPGGATQERPSIPVPQGKGNVVHVFLDTQGRKGKIVTVVAGVRHNPATMEDLARTLKQYCGAGGTVKNGNIEIQGDQCLRVGDKMKELGYVVKAGRGQSRE